MRIETGRPFPAADEFRAARAATEIVPPTVDQRIEDDPVRPGKA
jgi:hypothetical protein